MKTVKSRTTSPEPFVLHRQIGSTTYRVRLRFNPNAREALDDKIRRLLKNDLQSMPKDIRMDSLQADWLSERSSL